VFWLRRLKLNHAAISILPTGAELEFIEAERMRVRGFNFVSAILSIFTRENLHESVFCVHRVAVLSMFGVLLNVDDYGWGLLQNFKKGVF